MKDNKQSRVMFHLVYIYLCINKLLLQQLESYTFTGDSCNVLGDKSNKHIIFNK